MSQMQTPLLQIRALDAWIEDKQILHQLDLALNAGELHALMGPNGSGKSTLAALLAGREDVRVSGGEATLDGQDLLALPPEERATRGLFLSFQYPPEIAGLSNTTFLREIYNRKRMDEGMEPLDPLAFLRVLKHEMTALGMDEALARRALNDGFSGGEKKRNEILQLRLLAPRLAVLDETDSGLDVDALRQIARAINDHRSPERAVLVITHYQRLLAELMPPADRVHILSGGKIVRSGGPELALRLEKVGYDAIVAEAA